MITIHQRYRQTDRQTDRRTDRQTTCDRNTALCTKVHRGVKTTVALSNGSIADTLRHFLPPKWGSICIQYTRMAISPQRVIRYTSCLVLGCGFRGRRIELRCFRFEQIQDGGGGRHLGKISNGHISATGRPIHLYSAHRAVIYAIAQLSCFAYTTATLTQPCIGY